MILVTLGTQDKDFSRLLKAIDKLIEKKVIKEKVIVQAGYTKYKSKNMQIFDFVFSVIIL
jgi:UDP-N-acetylglucosamine transferase subunit ALG13